MTRLGQIYTKYKYKRDQLNIIQQIPTQQFQKIIQKYQQDGWELASEYHPADFWVNGLVDHGVDHGADHGVDHWKCKLRKGTSTLICEWNNEVEGEISGPQRIIIGLGKEFILSVRTCPTWF